MELVQSIFRRWCIVFFVFFAANSFANPPETSPEGFDFRNHMRDCFATFSPATPKVDGGIGLRMSGLDVDQFEDSLEKLIEEKGKEYFDGGHLYLTGVPMGEESVFEERFQEVAQKHQLGIAKIIPLSVPKELPAHPGAKDLFKRFFQEIVYFSPSITRDYQSPIFYEVAFALVSAAIIELPNALELLSTIPDKQLAWATLIIHSGLLIGYDTLSKSLNLWLQRDAFGAVGNYSKQALLSLPFVLNYHITTRLPEVLEYFTGLQSPLYFALDLPGIIADFGVGHGLTFVLQLAFFRMVMTDGIFKWMGMQKDAKKSAIARSMVHVLKIPFLALDAVAIFYATTNRHNFFQLGEFTVNSGHVMIAGLIAVGLPLYLRPAWLNIIFPVLEYIQNKYQRIRSFTKGFLGGLF